MEEIDALIEQHIELDELLADLDEDGWHRPTRCEGWDVADVVLHLVQTNEMAIGSATGRYAEVTAELGRDLAPSNDVDAGAAAMVARDRDATVDDIRSRWERSAPNLRDALAAAAPHDRVDWVAGQLSVRTLTTTRLAETWIHTGDVIDALGRPIGSSDRLCHIGRLAWRTLPYAFARAGRTLTGPVAFELDRCTFTPEEPALTTITGSVLDLCLVAGRRADAARTDLRGTGPDVDAVLELVRTYA